LAEPTAATGVATPPTGRPGRLDQVSPEALFVISAIAQYTGAIIAVHLFDEMAAESVGWFRVVGAALALLIFTHGGRSGRRWTRREVAIAGIFGTIAALMNISFYLALDRMDLGSSVAIEFIGPICVAAARTRSRRNSIALLLAVCGVLVLGGIQIGDDALGLAFVLIASGLWALYIIIGARVAGFDRGVSGLALGLIGAVVTSPIGLPNSGPAWSSPALLMTAMVVGVFSNAIGYGIDQHVMRKMSMRRFAVMLALLPVSALTLGYIALDQTPSNLQFVGVALILGGVTSQDRT
jgi:inner membrane transporter RhtA